jgi:hypothetical protein
MEIKAMKTAQGWGWLAAGVLALGLNGFYQDGGLEIAHRAVDGVVARIADRSGVFAEMASERVGRALESANLVAARDETASCRLATAMARLQTKMTRAQSGMARFEVMSAREEAAMARVEANRARVEAQVARVRFAPAAFNTVRIPVVACPRVRVNIPRVDVPAVHVDLGTGPI